MTSVLSLGNPSFHYQSCYSMSNNILPPPTIMSTLSKSSAQEDYSSADSESKKKQAATPGAKRRPSRAGTRSVTTLTAAQLERKRANDREAQRAIRQRTKDHIESLERRIAELTSNQDNHRLLEVMQRNEQLEQENAMLRDRLNHTLGYVPDNSGIPPTDPSLMASAGPTSPVDRMSILNQPRPSSASTARSVPSVATPTVTQPDAWQSHATYNPPPTSSPMEPHAPLGTAPDTRWSPHPHTSQTPVSAPLPSVPEGATAYHHSVEPQQMNYYVPYGQESSSQTQQHLPYGNPSQNPHHPSTQAAAPLSQVHPPPAAHEYGGPRHLPVQQQGYPTFQAHPAYMSTPPNQGAAGAATLQHAGEGLQMLQRGQGPQNVQDNHLMYGMTSNMTNMKVE